ncbi:hypothetical protein HMI55_005523 [Coelomomyces lativittatus]|nr:hypothetical protein HMI55_005523 [Coelomomyces lativittatus]KAJ1497991.1 hypothetical protein HMI56_005271 [Coelomomyces lativittatus]
MEPLFLALVIIVVILVIFLILQYRVHKLQIGQQLDIANLPISLYTSSPDDMARSYSFNDDRDEDWKNSSSHTLPKYSSRIDPPPPTYCSVVPS